LTALGATGKVSAPFASGTAQTHVRTAAIRELERVPEEIPERTSDRGERSIDPAAAGLPHDS